MRVRLLWAARRPVCMHVVTVHQTHHDFVEKEEEGQIKARSHSLRCRASRIAISGAARVWSKRRRRRKKGEEGKGL